MHHVPMLVAQTAFLDDFGRDALACASVLGVIIAIWQLWRTKRATIAAAASAADTIRKNKEHFNRYAAANARSKLNELTIHLDNADWKLAATRAADLADLAMQIAHVVPDDTAWSESAAQLREWHTRFGEVDREKKQFTGTLRNKWYKFVATFNRRVDAFHRPLPSFEKGENQ